MRRTAVTMRYRKPANQIKCNHEAPPLCWWWSSAVLFSSACALLPLALLIVPLGGDALHRVHPHVQHLLQLTSLPVLIQGPGLLRVDWGERGGRGAERGAGEMMRRRGGEEE